MTARHLVKMALQKCEPRAWEVCRR